MKFISKEELLTALTKKYGDLTDESGCYAGKGKWLSVSNIVDIVNSLDEYDDE